MTREKLIALPKIELHCHLDGSLSKEFIEKRLGREVSPKELSVSDDCTSLAEYLEKFTLPGLCIMDEEGLKESGYDVLKSMSRENVCYAEIRFAPLLSETEEMSCAKVIESLLEGLEKGRADFGVEFGVITCAMRHHSEEDNSRMIKTAREYLGCGVCAADLAGAEASYPMSEFMNLFQNTHKIGMPFTIHAGECGNAKKNRSWNCNERKQGTSEGTGSEGNRNRNVSDQQPSDKSGTEHCGISDQRIPGCRAESNCKHR